MDNYILGIDTGGTYTDGVLLDEKTYEIIKTNKTLTTRHDLSICILNTLEALLPDDPSCIRLVAISTTLATNAIAESKFRPVALFLVGYDSGLIERFDLGGRFVTPQYFYFKGGHNIYGQEQSIPDLEAVAKKAKMLQNKVEAFAVSAYFSPINTSHEERVYETLRSVTDHPVILGHQLSSRLDSVKRATTATLNASLLSISQEFISAMRHALDQRGVRAPLMVMRGDGALMNEKTANLRPVETIHSGPAASAIGGHFLAKQEKGLIIDIGGTTTDIAVIDNGRVAVLEEGTTVGRHRTSVRSANVHSFGLGGDSFITFDAGKRLQVGPSRVVPISYLAHIYPQVAAELHTLTAKGIDRAHPKQAEYWFLQREPRREIQEERAKKAIDLLRERPLSLAELLKRLDLKIPRQFGGDWLVEEDIVGRSALTPTDLLHLSGEYTPWDREAARVAASIVAEVKDWTIDDLSREVHQYIAETIVAEIVSFVSGQTLERSQDFGLDRDMGQWLFEENLYGSHPYLGCSISLKMPIIGMGAPANIYLPRVAELLHTELILPPNFQVANAVGAAVGNVMVCHEATLSPMADLMSYNLKTGKEQRQFANLTDAVSYAKEVIGSEALAEAEAAGAVEPHLEFQQVPTGAGDFRLQAMAIGRPRLD